MSKSRQFRVQICKNSRVQHLQAINSISWKLYVNITFYKYAEINETYATTKTLSLSIHLKLKCTSEILTFSSENSATLYLCRRS